MLVHQTTLTFLALLALVRVATIKAAAADDGNIVEPPFPSILKSDMIRNKQIKIISEVVGDDVGYQTTEEYADFEKGRAAYLVTSHDKGQEVVLSDTRWNSIFKYRPYRCNKFAADDKIYDNLDDLSIHYETHDTFKAVFGGHKSTYVRMFGVVGLWMSATNKPKSYSQSKLIFSTSKDIYRPSHNWEYINKNLSFTFHFIDANYSPKSNNSEPPELSLEMIQIKSASDKKLLRTINVMMIDYWLQPDIFNTYLELPVGYGCLAEEPEPVDEAVTSWYSFDLDHGRAELELTETRILADGGKKSRATRTVNVELAHTRLNKFDLTQTRVKNNNEDIRTVYWNEFRTKFTIDMRKSSCQMSHLSVDDVASPAGQQDNNNNRQKKSMQSIVDEGRLIRFSNESALPLDQEMLDLLFVQKEGFRFVKKSESGPKQAQHLYFERVVPRWPYNLDGTKSSATVQPLARIIRNFVDSNGLRILESVTVWVFDQDSSQIVLSYHINLINYEEIHPYADVARVFDVSDECYLNNPQYRSGKQYAWIELFYPTTSRMNDLLAQKAHFKETIYEKMLSTPSNLHLSSFRMPRMELMFDDEGLVVRSLLLDRPPIELVFEPLDNTLIKPDQTKEVENVFEFQPDIAHCAKLCQLHACKAMSFCGFHRSCWLSSERPSLEGGHLSRNVTGCQTYLLPRADETNPEDESALKELHQSSLHQILSKLQHQDYGVIPLPKAPEELLMPPSESGLDEAAYMMMVEDYGKELSRFLREDAQRVPELSLIVMLNGHVFVLLASKFTVEDDPLDQFDLLSHEAEDSLEDDLDDQGPKSGAYFHGVLSNSRYKLTAFMASAERARQFDGLTYDQCALACVDNRCGSFSHCLSRRECIITSVNNTRMAQAMNAIDSDYDCMISQRDFLKNFKLFEGVYAPALNKRQTQGVTNPSDCALECMSATDFKCMSFQFCRASKTCYYQNIRHPAGIYATSAKRAKAAPSSSSSSSSSSSLPATGCDHYERSVLADFNAIEYRQIEPAQLARLKTTTFEGKSIFQCADICANQLADCSAFQFCFNHRTGFGQLRPQECQMIRSKAGGDGDDDVDQTADNNGTSSEQDFAVVVDANNHDQVVSAGKFIIRSEQCHLFSLRRDTGEAHLRELALPNALTLQESQELEASRGGAGGGGLSLVGAFSLFVGVCLVATGVGFAASVASERNDFIRQKIERGRLLLGV